jgi:hypothetical protein
MDIVLSHPFSGALYAFFTEQATGEKVPEKIGHPYYQTLYGKNHYETQDLALTQLLMYEKVFIVPADNHMPEYKNHSSGGKYENNELGLFTDWDEHQKAQDEIEAQIELDQQDSVISRILAKVPLHSKRQILRDARLEVALANKFKCPILAGGGRNTIIKRLFEIDGNFTTPQLVGAGVVRTTEHYINLASLTFKPTNYDLLYSYKQDRELRLYADSLRKIVSGVGESDDPRKELLLLMRESMENNSLTKKASGFLDVTSILLSLAGFIPVAGPFFSAAALAATAGGKTFDRQARRTWYEFGPRIKRITDFKEMELLIATELADT